MNERIKQLVDEATIKTSHKYHTWGDRIATETEEVFDKEKFAELIVGECIQVCVDRGTHHDGLYSAWADDCSKRIGKHFGVEE